MAKLKNYSKGKNVSWKRKRQHPQEGGSIYQKFRLWLDTNRESLKNDVKMVKVGRNCFEFQLAGVTSHIHFSISNSGEAFCYAVFQGKIWDILADFDVIEKRTPTGSYYCSECLSENIKYYGTRFELWSEHTFTPLFRWIDENFAGDNYLCFFEYGERQGITEAKIVKFDDLDTVSSEDRNVSFVPIVVSDES